MIGDPNKWIPIWKNPNPGVSWCEFWFWFLLHFCPPVATITTRKWHFSKIFSILSVSSEIMLKLNKTNQNQNPHQLTPGLGFFQIGIHILGSPIKDFYCLWSLNKKCLLYFQRNFDGEYDRKLKKNKKFPQPGFEPTTLKKKSHFSKSVCNKKEW